MTILDVFQWLEGTWPAVWARESAYGFVILVGIHLLGLIFSVGTLFWLDLRLLGVCTRRVRVSELNRALAPWFLSGFGMMFLSGAILFAGYATSAYGNLFFRIKLVAIALAGLNAAIYHFTTGQAIPAWDHASRPPRLAQLAGLTSIVLWFTVIVSGRMMSYTMF